LASTGHLEKGNLAPVGESASLGTLLLMPEMLFHTHGMQLRAPGMQSSILGTESDILGTRSVILGRVIVILSGRSDALFEGKWTQSRLKWIIYVFSCLPSAKGRILSA
jgi:hypothetical protein